MSRPPKSLVLVIGAGASKEVGLPIGAELKSSIAQALDIRYDRGSTRASGDGLVDGALQAIARTLPAPHTDDVNMLFHAGRQISKAMPLAISIDNFIDSHRGNKAIELCGKVAITRCILAAERRSKLFVDPSNYYNTLNFSNVEGTWYNSFFQVLTENCQVGDLPTRLAKVAVVSFNYDRCVEHYLHAALRTYYDLTADEAAAILKHLHVHHPYGTVGTLPWQGCLASQIPWTRAPRICVSPLRVRRPASTLHHAASIRPVSPSLLSPIPAIAAT